MKTKPIGIVFAANMHRGRVIGDYVIRHWFREGADIVILTPRSLLAGRGRGCTALDNIWWDIAIPDDPHTMHVGTIRVDHYIRCIVGSHPRYEYVNIEVQA